jgi:NTP pyrophosphatase (non-canonical NTP hydrolase)
VVRWAQIICLAGAALWIATGCGGGDTSTESLTKADYIAQADAICKSERAKRDELESQVNDLAPITSQDTGEVADLLRQSSENLKGEIRQLRALHPPPADAGTLDSMLSTLGAEVAETDRWADAYDNQDEREIRLLQVRIADLTARASGIAQRYGFKACGQDSQSSAPTV